MVTLLTQDAETYRSTVPYVSAAIQTVLDFHDASSVTVVGHSLGAALALLDGAYLAMRLPSEISVTVVGYGMPRVGPLMTQFGKITS